MQRSGEITPAARRLGEVEARGLGREEVGDVAGDQRAGRGHADEDRARPGADAGAGLLAQRGVGLVADHDRVGVGDPLRVAHEPLVGLDGDRPVGVVAAVEQRRPQPLLVAAVGDLADELVDEVAAVGEDQDAAGARGLDEADRGDGLAGAGRVLEPEAPLGAGVLGRLLDRSPRRLPGSSSQSWGSSSSAPRSSSTSSSPAPFDRQARLGGLGSPDAASPAASPSGAVAAPVRRRALLLGDQLGEGSGERVDLVRGELGAVAQLRRLLGEQPLEPEQQREVRAPLDRGRLGAGVELGQRGVERPAPGGAGRQRLADSRPRAGTARGRTSPPARSRRLKELPPARQLRWSWP